MHSTRAFGEEFSSRCSPDYKEHFLYPLLSQLKLMGTPPSPPLHSFIFIPLLYVVFLNPQSFTFRTSPCSPLMKA